MELKTILYDVQDRIATITLNRPHRMNAWTGRMHTEYRYALDQADRDGNVSVIVVTGAENSFCAGADTAALEGHAARGGYDAGTAPDIVTPGKGDFSPFQENFSYHFALEKPVIAAINGPAAGVGLVLACFADLRFAVEGAKFTTAHGRFNLPAEYGLSWLLPRLIGLTKANDLLLSSRVFLAEEAMDLGLLNGVMSREELVPYVYDYARTLAEKVSPGSLKETKRQIYTDLHRDVGEAVREADQLLSEMVKSPNYNIGVKAFMKKQKADWEYGE